MSMNRLQEIKVNGKKYFIVIVNPYKPVKDLTAKDTKDKKDTK